MTLLLDSATTDRVAPRTAGSPTQSGAWPVMTRYALRGIVSRAVRETVSVAGPDDLPTGHAPVIWIRVDPTRLSGPEAISPVLAEQTSGEPAVILRRGGTTRVRTVVGVTRILPPIVRAWTPIAVLPSQPSGAALAGFALRGARITGLGAALGGLVGTLCGLAAPLVALVAALTGSGWWLLAAAGALAVSLGIGLITDRCSAATQRHAQQRLEQAVWQRLLALPAAFFARHSLRSAIGYANAVGMCRALLGAAGIDAVLGALTAGLAAAGFFVVDWRIGLVAVAVMVVLLTATWVLSVRQQRYDRDVLTGVDDVQALLYPALLGIDEVAGYHAQPIILRRWQKVFGAQKAADDAGLRFAEVAGALLGAAQPILFAAVLPVVAAVQPYALPLAVLVTVQLSGSLSRLAGAIPAVFSVALAHERLRPVLTEPVEPAPTRPCPPLSGALSLVGLHHRYPGSSADVLADVSLNVRPGEFVAVVGGSGSGKSTLLRLLLGLIDPTAGEIRYDDCPMAALDRDAVRRQIGYVPQDGRMLRGTIRSVIGGPEAEVSNTGAPDADVDAQIWAAAAAAHIDDDIRSLPMGLATRVTDGDGSFSGGQAQRLLLARALARSPRVLLLDEATSALDESTQHLVATAVADLSLTRIVVAHRLSTIRRADRIVVLDNGQIAAEGSFDALLSSSPAFRRLIQADHRPGRHARPEPFPMPIPTRFSATAPAAASSVEE